MLTGKEISQEQINSLLDDAGYLADEAEALKYIIDQVPYTEVPTDGMSIIQRLALIDHAQTSYYRPLVEKAFASTRSLSLDKFDSYKETFEFDDDEKDVQKVLSKIIKHRAAILNLFNKIPLIDWERGLKNQEGSTISLYEFANSMITNERRELKEIADLVLIYQHNKQANREAAAKSRERHGSGE